MKWRVISREGLEKFLYAEECSPEEIRAYLSEYDRFGWTRRKRIEYWSEERFESRGRKFPH